MSKATSKKPKLHFTPSPGRVKKDPKAIREAINRIRQSRKGRTLGDTTIEELLREVRGNS